MKSRRPDKGAATRRPSRRRNPLSLACSTPIKIAIDVERREDQPPFEVAQPYVAQSSRLSLRPLFR
jgi:hypothetical protein